MNEQKVEFQSAGERIIGLLHLPSSPARGVIVTTGPLTAVKEQAPGAYARALAARGFAALAFDHRTFGESGGQPRQFENPLAKIEDIRSAVTFLKNDGRTQDLPMFAVGICAGGGYMAAAVAQEPRFRAFAGVAGVYSDAVQAKIGLGADYEKAISRATAAETRWRETGVAEAIPAVAADNGDVAMPLNEAYEYYGTPRGAVPNYVNGFAVMSRLYTLPFDAQVMAARITAATLVVHSDRALAPAWAHAFVAKLTAPKRELWLTSKGQIDFYDDPRLINESSDAIAAHFLGDSA